MTLTPNSGPTLVAIWPCSPGPRHAKAVPHRALAIKDLVSGLGVSEHTLHPVATPGLHRRRAAPGSQQLRARPAPGGARIKELEAELTMVKAASALFEKCGASPKGSTRLSESFTT